MYLILISNSVKKISKKFFVQTLSEDSGALSYENYYTNIRHKTKQIEAFKERIEEIGKCEESDLLIQHCETLQKDINDLMDLFKGKATAKKTEIIYIPMDTNHVIDYLGYLITDGIDKNLDSIRNTMNALDYETGTTQEDKNQISYYKKLINHFKTRVDDVKEP